jgi:4-amino-4-deoxy-L-arabinose transferase-like glycosyltransferase
MKKLAVGVCVIAFAFMLYASFRESAIVDESAHMPAGYGYVRHLDFRLNPEHPPLVKALSAAPLLAIQPNFPTDSSAWTDGVNEQWTMGEQFLYRSGNDADKLLQLSRLAPILLTVLLVFFTYFWSRKLMGDAWALLPTFLLAFSPIILSHGHYVTTDIGAAFGILFSTYFFLKFLRDPSPRNILFAGITLGIAQLMKFSVVLVIPYFVILAIIYFFMIARGLRGKHFWKAALRQFVRLILVFVVAMAVIYAVYALFVANYPLEKQVSDTQTILTSFAGGQPEMGERCAIMRCIADANVWMAGHSATRPLAEYFLGVLMVVQRSSGGNTAYFLDQVSSSGSHLYFPVAYLLKESLPALLILLTGLVLTLWGMARRAAHGNITAGIGTYLRDHFTEFSLILFLFIYWAYSINSTLNIGVRHLMPVIPLMYMLAAGSWRKWISNIRLAPGNSPLTALAGAARGMAVAWLKFSILCALLLWVMMETLVAAPNFLSYYNQIGGGTREGYRYITDSNYDWGQDMLRLREFVEEHPEIDRIAVDYFGTGGAVDYYLGERAVGWWSARGNPADEGIQWLAVSINSLQSAIQPTAEHFNRKPEDSYEWLTAMRPAPEGMGRVPDPDFRVGMTVFVYRL